MAYTFPLLLAICGCMSLCLAYHGEDLPKGPFCGITGRCCSQRHDDCAHRILDSLCYCDEFCNRTRSGLNDDCCPDYEEVCLGIRPPPPTVPPPQLVLGCKMGARAYEPGDFVERGCNKCYCRYPNLPQTGYWECEQDPCIITDEVLQRVNQDRRLGWRAANYSEFSRHKLRDGLIYKLGTLPLSPLTMNLGAIYYDKNVPYPKNFDARQQWPRYISPVRDQGWCGSDWAVSIADIASDRLAIQSNGAEVIQLSPQTLVSCNTNRHQQACLAGEVTAGWVFVKKYGLMDENCFRYNTSVPRCPPRFKRGNLISDGCRPAVPQRTSRYKVGPPGKLVKEQDIMYDIMESGPVQAVMTVYQDFFHYRDGIYRRSRYGNYELKGLHSVRIIGWGEDYGQKFWIVANSWGAQWGENGFFRIARGENESGIESFVITAPSYVTEAYRKK